MRLFAQWVKGVGEYLYSGGGVTARRLPATPVAVGIAPTRSAAKQKLGVSAATNLLCGLGAAFMLSACAYPSNVANDIAYMGDPAYDECRRNADTLSNYGARCAKEADPKVKAARAEQARQTAEQQRQAAGAAQQQADAQRSADAEKGYNRITVRDFVLDGQELASRSAKLSLVGVYLPAGNLELLFGSSVDAVQFANGDVQNGPVVHLLTANATREFRGQLLTCRGNPAAAYVGCPARIVGTATRCVLSNALGGRREVPCVSVDEGSLGR